MANSLTALIEKHVQTLQNHALELVGFLQAQPPRIDEAQQLAHMLKGSSGSLGFRDFSNQTGKIEEHCKALQDGRVSELDPNLAIEFERIASQLAASDSAIYKDTDL